MNAPARRITPPRTIYTRVGQKVKEATSAQPPSARVG
jgi:hypothetical protein